MKACVLLCVISLISTISASDVRISGGQQTTVSKYPFAAALLTNLGSGEYHQRCGGTILTSSAILSAASCFHTAGNIHPVAWWRARVGSSSASSRGIVHMIRLINRHPDFNHATLNNDIAVVRLAALLTFVPGAVQPAYIAGRNYQLANQQSVYAIGWGGTSDTVGSSEELREVQLWVVEERNCVERYAPLNVAVTTNMVCAGFLDVGNRGQCQGDTGGPLLHNKVVVGVHSWTEGCGRSRYPSINTRVSLYARWIEAVATAA